MVLATIGGEGAVYPEGAPDQNRYGDQWSGQPTGADEASPREYEILPGYPQPAYPPPAYPQPGYPPPAYPQPEYPPQGYPQPGYPQPGYQPPPALPAPPRSGVSGQVLAIACAAVVAVIAVVAVAIWAVTRPGGAPAAGGGPSPAASTAPSPQLPGNDPGPADPAGGLLIGSGPVRVDVYVDYQCPPCGVFEEEAGDALTGYLAANRITLSIHPVAFIDRRSLNQYSTRAAAAMACAYEQGKGLAFHVYLLHHQPPEDTAGPTDAGLVTAGASIGLGAGFATCVTDGEKIAWVGEATSAAQRSGVSSVPALYVNHHETAATRSNLVTAVDSAP